MRAMVGDVEEQTEEREEENQEANIFREQK